MCDDKRCDRCGEKWYLCDCYEDEEDRCECCDYPMYRCHCDVAYYD